MSQSFEEIPADQHAAQTSPSIENISGNPENISNDSKVDLSQKTSWQVKAFKTLWHHLDKVAYLMLLFYIALLLSTTFGSHHTLTPLPLPPPISISPTNLQTLKHPEIAQRKEPPKKILADEASSEKYENQKEQRRTKPETEIVAVQEIKKPQVNSNLPITSQAIPPSFDSELSKITASDQQNYEEFKKTMQMAPHRYLKKLQGSVRPKRLINDEVALEERFSRVLSDSRRREIIMDYLSKHKDDDSMWLSYLLKDGSEEMSEKMSEWMQENTLIQSDEEQKLCIVVNAFNNGRHKQIQRTLSSIKTQKYSQYRVILVDRGSTDNTLDYVSDLLNTSPEWASKVTVLKKEAIPFLKGTHQGIKECAYQEIAVVIDGNSEFLGESVLTRLHNQYSRKAKVVYSGSFSLDYASQRIRQERVEAYDESENFMLLYRFNPKKFASLFSFRMSVMDRINESHLNKNGIWYGYTGNDALAYAILEASCGKTGVIKKPLLLHQVDTVMEKEDAKKIRQERVRMSEESKIDIC